MQALGRAELRACRHAAAGGPANALRALATSEQEHGSDFLRMTNAHSALYPRGCREQRVLDAMLLAIPRRRMTVPMLDSLRLKRFRSLLSAEIELADPTFLVGQNGAGKSNIVDVFAFLADAKTSPLEAVFDRRGGIAAVRNRSSARGRPSNLGLGAVLNAQTAPARYALELRTLENYGFEVVREQLCPLLRDDEFDVRGSPTGRVRRVGRRCR